MRIHLITGQQELQKTVGDRSKLIFGDRPGGLTFITSSTLLDARLVLAMEPTADIILLDVSTPIEPPQGNQEPRRDIYTAASFLFMAKNEKWPPIIAVGSNRRYVGFTRATGIHPLRDCVRIQDITSTDEIDDLLDLIEPALAAVARQTQPRY